MTTWIYNDFFWALVLTSSDSKRPITSGLGRLTGEFVWKLSLRDCDGWAANAKTLQQVLVRRYLLLVARRIEDAAKTVVRALPIYGHYVNDTDCSDDLMRKHLCQIDEHVVAKQAAALYSLVAEFNRTEQQLRVGDNTAAQLQLAEATRAYEQAKSACGVISGAKALEAAAADVAGDLLKRQLALPRAVRAPGGARAGARGCCRRRRAQKAGQGRQDGAQSGGGDADAGGRRLGVAQGSKSLRRCKAAEAPQSLPVTQPAAWGAEGGT
jgi:hypothetical protein